MRRILSLSSISRRGPYNRSMDSTLRLFALLMTLASGLASAANHEVAMNPISPGPFAVACSNVAMDAGAIAASGETAENFWEGRNGRFVSDILTERQTALTFAVRVPFQFNLYPRWAGRNLDFAAIVCHPTSRQNTDANYPLPGSNGVVPHMQPAGAAPKLISQLEFNSTVGLPVQGAAPGPARLPLI